MGGEENFIKCYDEATSVKYGYLICDWRKDDYVMNQHGGDCSELTRTT